MGLSDQIVTPGQVIGAGGGGGGASSLADLIDWPSEITPDEVAYLDGLMQSLSTSLAGKLDDPSGTTSQLMLGDGSASDTLPAAVQVPLDQVNGGASIGVVKAPGGGADLVAEALVESEIPALSISKTTGLQTALDGKAASSHTHAQSDVTNLVSDLAAKVAKSTATTKGDLLVATASATLARLGLGTNGQVLTADSAQTEGVKWADAPVPAFVGCQVYRGSNQTLTRNSANYISFTSEEFATTGTHSTASNQTRFVAPTTGYYRLTAQIGISLPGGVTVGFKLQVRKNGTTAYAAYNYWYYLDGSRGTLIVDKIVQATAGDYFEINVHPNQACLAIGGEIQANFSKVGV